MAPRTAIHLCSGYGGFELALRDVWPELRTVAHVERDAYAASTLVARMGEARLDQAPIWDDLTTFDGRPWRSRVDCITAGFPCQPFSSAGKRGGVGDERWLWPDIARIIRDVGPELVLLENVPRLVRYGLPEVLDDLAALGFDAEWGVYEARAIGAPHRRKRLWLAARMAHAESDRLDWWPRGPRSSAATETQDSRAHQFPPAPLAMSEHGWRGPQPTVRRRSDGPPLGLADALHLGGNGLVPQCGAEAIRQLLGRMT